jgi:beta-glucanase (GH16 family)
MLKISYTNASGASASVLARSVTAIDPVADQATSSPPVTTPPVTTPSTGTGTTAPATGAASLVWSLPAPVDTSMSGHQDALATCPISGPVSFMAIVRGRAANTSGGAVAISFGDAVGNNGMFSIEMGGGYHGDQVPSLSFWGGDDWDRGLLLPGPRPASGDYVIAAIYDAGAKTISARMNGGQMVTKPADLNIHQTALRLGYNPKLTGTGTILSDGKLWAGLDMAALEAEEGRQMQAVSSGSQSNPPASSTPPVSEAPPVSTPPVSTPPVSTPPAASQPADPAPVTSTPPATSTPATPAPAAGSVVIAAPASGATVSGVVQITGTVPAGYVNMAAYDESGNKVCADVAPVNGTFALSFDASRAFNGAHKLAVVAFAAAAGTLGGGSIKADLPITVQGGLVPQPFVTAGMKLVFEETFAGTSVDQSKWFPGLKPSAGGQDWSDAHLVGANEPQFKDVYIVKDGVLTIKCIQDDNYKDPWSWNRKWYGGELSTARPDGTIMAAIRKGVFEVEMKMPNGQGQGPWPGFWLLNTGCIDQSKGDPGAVEIDIEAYGFPNAWNPTVHNHTAGKAVNGPEVHDSTTVGGLPDITADFHTYSIQVTDNEIIWFFDHIEKWRRPLPRATDATLGKFFLLMDMTVGGGWPITKPAAGYYACQFKNVRIWSAD